MYESMTSELNNKLSIAQTKASAEVSKGQQIGSAIQQLGDAVTKGMGYYAQATYNSEKYDRQKMLADGQENFYYDENGDINPNAVKDYSAWVDQNLDEWAASKGGMMKGLLGEYRQSFKDDAIKSFDENLILKIDAKNQLAAQQTWTNAISAFTDDDNDLSLFEMPEIYKTSYTNGEFVVTKEKIKIQNLYDTESDNLSPKQKRFNQLLNILYESQCLIKDQDTAKAFVDSKMEDIEKSIISDEMYKLIDDWTIKGVENPDGTRTFMSKYETAQAVKSLYLEGIDKPYTTGKFTGTEAYNYSQMADEFVNTIWTNQENLVSEKFQAEILPEMIAYQNNKIEFTEKDFDEIIGRHGIDPRFATKVKVPYQDTFRRNETMVDLREWFANGTPSDALYSEMKQYIAYDYENGEWIYDSDAGWGLMSGGIVSVDEEIYNASVKYGAKEKAAQELSDLGKSIQSASAKYDSSITEYVVASTSNYSRGTDATRGIVDVSNGALAIMEKEYTNISGNKFDYSNYLSEDPLAEIENYAIAHKTSYKKVVSDIKALAEKEGIDYYAAYSKVLSSDNEHMNNQMQFDLTRMKEEAISNSTINTVYGDVYLYQLSTPDGVSSGTVDEYINNVSHYYLNNDGFDKIVSDKKSLEMQKAYYNGDINEEGVPKDFNSTAYKNLQDEVIRESVQKDVTTRQQTIKSQIEDTQSAKVSNLCGFGFMKVLNMFGEKNPDGSPIDINQIRNSVLSSNQYTPEEKDTIIWMMGSDIALALLGSMGFTGVSSESKEVLGDVAQNSIDVYGDVKNWLESLDGPIAENCALSLMKFVKENEQRLGDDWTAWGRELSNYVSKAKEIASDYFVEMCVNTSGKIKNSVSAKNADTFSNDFLNDIALSGRDYNSDLNQKYGLSDLVTSWVNGDIALTGNLSEVTLFDRMADMDFDECVMTSMRIAAQLLGKDGQLYEGKNLNRVVAEMKEVMFDTNGKFKYGNAKAEAMAEDYGLITALASLIYNYADASKKLVGKVGKTDTYEYVGTIGYPTKINADGTIQTSRGASVSIGYKSDKSTEKVLTLVPKNAAAGSGGINIDDISFSLVEKLSRVASERAEDTDVFFDAYTRHMGSIYFAHESEFADEDYHLYGDGIDYKTYTWTEMCYAAQDAGQQIDMSDYHLTRDDDGKLQFDPAYYSSYFDEDKIPVLYSGVSINGLNLNYSFSLDANSTFNNTNPYDVSSSVPTKTMIETIADEMDKAFPVMPTYNFTM